MNQTPGEREELPFDSDLSGCRIDTLLQLVSTEFDHCARFDKTSHFDIDTLGVDAGPRALLLPQ
jgi:hypothetical protein